MPKNVHVICESSLKSRAYLHAKQLSQSSRIWVELAALCNWQILNCFHNSLEMKNMETHILTFFIQLLWQAKEGKSCFSVTIGFCSQFYLFIFILFIFQLATFPSELELILTMLSGTVLLQQTRQLRLNNVVLLVELSVSNLHISKFPVRFPIF